MYYLQVQECMHNKICALENIFYYIYGTFYFIGICRKNKLETVK